ncbi:MAG: nuclear transport factor 2 family protein [Pseudonocardiaceae bacterium]|nr:nuclear transport factor 2 family protein [Pseudonocardiaceae bacterium]
MHPFVALLRRYVVDYTNRHDTAVCDEIMEPGYVLHMGPHEVAGRDEAYKPAAAAQFRQFPGLGLTVHELVTSGDRLALRFSEHGASQRHGGRAAAWGGLGLYRWNGSRLTENFVEQDYLARRRQLDTGRCDPVEPPAVAPWDTAPAPADATAERVVRDWLAAGLPAGRAGISCDDEPTGRPPAPLIEVRTTQVDELFSAGDRVAFHVACHGRYLGGLDGTDGRIGCEATLHLGGLVTVTGGRVVDGRLIRDRLGLQRALRQDEPAHTGSRP